MQFSKRACPKTWGCGARPKFFFFFSSFICVSFQIFGVFFAEKMIKLGFQLVTIGSDQRYMTAASKAALNKLKRDEKSDTGKGY